MYYFNEEQIQRIAEAFPQEVRDTFKLNEIKSCDPTLFSGDTIANAIKRKYSYMDIHGMSTGVDIRFSFEYSENYDEPSKIFAKDLRKIEEELSNIFGYKVKASVYMISEAKEPDEIPPLYCGEPEVYAKYGLTIRICTDK